MCLRTEKYFNELITNESDVFTSFYDDNKVCYLMNDLPINISNVHYDDNVGYIDTTCLYTQEHSKKEIAFENINDCKVFKLFFM